jgi:hypothetical protein
MKTQQIAPTGDAGAKSTGIRWSILAILFIVTAINQLRRPRHDLDRRPRVEKAAGPVAGADKFWVFRLRMVLRAGTTAGRLAKGVGALAGPWCPILRRKRRAA